MTAKGDVAILIKKKGRTSLKAFLQKIQVAIVVLTG